MRHRLRIAAFLLAAPAVPASAQSPAMREKVIQWPCERACVETLADEFLKALATHDAAVLPLHRNARYTENGQVMGFDEGLWQTASKAGASRNLSADPQGHQIGFCARVEETGRSLDVRVRIRFVLHGSLNRGLGTLPPLDFVQIGEVELVTAPAGAGPACNDMG